MVQINQYLNWDLVKILKTFKGGCAYILTQKTENLLKRPHMRMKKWIMSFLLETFAYLALFDAKNLIYRVSILNCKIIFGIQKLTENWLAYSWPGPGLGAGGE